MKKLIFAILLACALPIYADETIPSGETLTLSSGSTLKVTGATLIGFPTGAGAFTGLSDVPASYVGQTLKAVRVNAGETGLEFYTPAGGGGDASTNTASSVTNEVVLFADTTGKLLKRATGSGIATLASGVLGNTPDNHTNWDTAFTDRLKWDGGATGLVAATGRTSLALDNVTNDAQTKASIVPNTAPSSGQILVGNAGNTAYAKQTLSGSGATATISSSGVLTLSGIANATLTNSAITIAGTSTSLGGSITLDTIDNGISTVGLIKRTGANTRSIATAGTDYLNAVTAPITNTSGNVGLDVTVDHAFQAQQTFTITDANISLAPEAVVAIHKLSSGTTGIDFGTGLKVQGHTTTGTVRDMGDVLIRWSDPADATRLSKIEFHVVNVAGGGTVKKMALFGGGGLSVGGLLPDPGDGYITTTNGYKVNNVAINFSNLAGTVDLGGAQASGTLAAARFPALTGDVTTSAGSLATTIANNAVTYAKMQDVSAASKLLGRGSAAGAGDPQEITLGTNLTMSGTTINASGGSTVVTTSPITGDGSGGSPVGLDTTVDLGMAAAQTITLNPASAGSVLAVLGLQRNTTGTPANGIGSAISFLAEDSTTVNQQVAQISGVWSDVTHASRTGYIDFQIENNGGLFTGKARLFGSGGFSVNNNTDPGAGIISANTGYWVGTAAPTSGKIMQSDGAAFKASTATWPSTGTNGQVVTYDGTNFGTSTAPEDKDLSIYKALGSVVVATPSRGVEFVNANHTLASGTCEFFPIWLPVNATITGVKFYQITQGNFTADTSNIVALYTYSAGTLTRVAISTDDANLWKAATGTWSSKAFTATYSATAGLLYVGVLYHSSAQTTAPVIGGTVQPSSAGVNTFDFTNSAKFQSTLGAQTTLPSSQAMSGLTSANSSQIWMALY